MISNQTLSSACQPDHRLMVLIPKAQSLIANVHSTVHTMVPLHSVRTAPLMLPSPVLPKRVKVNVLVTLSTFSLISPMAKKFQKPPSFALEHINHFAQLERNLSAP